MDKIKKICLSRILLIAHISRYDMDLPFLVSETLGWVEKSQYFLIVTRVILHIYLHALPQIRFRQNAQNFF